ncbi:MAG: exopolysaccharide biosynthesis protein [Microbacteriaceae bacterium]|nr:exopolysaccharide biosynthesis protein [Microbacteriaceae bacterium]
MNTRGRPTPRELATSFFASPRLANGLTTLSVAVAVLSTAIEAIIGWPGLIAMTTALVVLAALSLVARRESIDWHGLLPISLLAFIGWLGLSIFWSQYQWATLGAIAYFVAFTALGLYIALMRDTIQIVRSFGDMLRFVLVASLALEIFSGLLIDTPLTFLGVQANLAAGGPIQGLLGTRNQLGIVALIAAVTFGTELRTKSIRPGVAIASLGLAAVMMGFSRSALIGGVIVVLAAAGLALYVLRRVAPEHRTMAQLSLLVVAAVLALGAWLFRTRIVSLSNAGGDLDYRLALWRQMTAFIGFNPLEGWGWIGYWRSELLPFPAFALSEERVPISALNAYLDVWFQLGLVGAAIFVGLVGLAFVRSWLLAGQRRSIVYAWPALVLVVLLTSALFESSLLVEYGWLTFVVCCVKASRELSWRKAFERPLEQEPLD